ncbi:MAG TPA: ABC transporter permease [Candidatus Binatia bacterium]|nr:ABC transporter permease [Candidatus Binatia bacterium]
MARLVLRRGGLALATAVGVLTLVIALLRAIPGDPVDAMLGERATAADRAELRSALGLDRPAWSELAARAAGLARGDLGRSIATGDPVASLLAARYPATLELAAAALAAALAIGVPIGIAAAARPGGRADRASLAFATFAAAMPTFALGPLLLLAFAVEVPWFPVAGRSGPASVVLPALTLGLGMAAVLARQLRAALAAALSRDFARAARARGASRVRLVAGHGLRNAATPAIAVLAVQIGGLLAGAVVTETVFAWPGIGRLLVQAIGARDYPVVQGCALAIALTFVGVSLVADLLQAWVDPRLRAAR